MSDLSSIFTRTLALPAGPRVRLRHARRTDRKAVRELLAGRGVTARDIDVRRLLAFDPAERVVLCAVAPIDGRETLVGLGAINLTEDADVDTLVVDAQQTAGLAELLGEVLRRAAEAHAKRVA